jgi:3-hydroxybutyryl-CoA dehydratase
MRWYCDALETAAAADGVFRIAEPTIHTDDEYARAQGLPGIIADGMISTNWLSSLLYEHFGLPFLANGELTTKFIRPIYEDEVIETHAIVTGVDASGDQSVYELEIWCQTVGGDKCTVGSARVPLTATA